MVDSHKKLVSLENPQIMNANAGQSYVWGYGIRVPSRGSPQESEEREEVGSGV